MDDIVAFGTPGNVVGIAESVHLESANVGWQESEVLSGRSKHVPWVEVEERHQEIDTDRRSGGDY